MKLSATVSLLAVVALSMAGCGSNTNDKPAGATSGASGDRVCAKTDASGDLLASVCDAGKLKVATNAGYPPQSSLNQGTGEWEGFDIDVATEIAHRLGVDITWITPSWDVLTAGHWSGRWDMSVGSMTPTNDRQKVLDFTKPYSYAPAVVVVHKDNTSIKDLSTDLDGKDIGVASASTFEDYLNHDLNIQGYSFNFIIDQPQVHTYDASETTLQDLALGDGVRLDAAITSPATAQSLIDAGKSFKLIGDPVFYEPLSIAFDKGSPTDATTLFEAVDKIVGEMHQDGTLTRFSKKWYDGADVTVEQ